MIGEDRSEVGYLFPGFLPRRCCRPCAHSFLLLVLCPVSCPSSLSRQLSRATVPVDPLRPARVVESSPSAHSSPMTHLPWQLLPAEILTDTVIFSGSPSLATPAPGPHPVCILCLMPLCISHHLTCYMLYLPVCVSPPTGRAVSCCTGCALHSARGHCLHRLQCDRAASPPGGVQPGGPSPTGIRAAFFFFPLPYLSCLEHWWLRWERICMQQRKPRFDPWVGRIPCRRAWQPTPVFLPGKSPGQRRLGGYSPRGHKESHMTE